MFKKEIGVKWKIFAYFSLFSLIMILLLWLFQIVFLNVFYKTIKINEIYSTAQTIQKSINDDNFEETITKLAKSRDICISLYSLEGEIVCSPSALMNCIIHKFPASSLYGLATEILADKNEYFEHFSPNVQKSNRFLPPNKREFANSVLLIKRMANESGKEYIIVLNSVIEPVFSTTSTLKTQLVCITIIMLFLSFILSLIISKKISSPIININNSAKKLANEYNIKFEDKGYKEISELANTLTYVSEEMSKVENLRRELIANVSHDLRTPLTMIAGYAEVIRDIPGENTPENVQVIIDETTRLTTLVNDLLDISKFQSGNNTLKIEKFNLTDCIEKILLRYSKLIEKDNYKFVFEKDTEVEIEGDELRLSQVIYNLINNAITYTGKDKIVKIRQTASDEKVKIEIIDSGNGISEDEIPYIWDRYYKAKGSHKRAEIGTGLGLAIVKEVLTLHNAEFGVKNNEDKGANFWFETKRVVIQ